MTDLPAIAAVVFDMDGVLIDTEPLYKKAMLQTVAGLGHQMTEDMFVAQIGAPTDRGDELMRGFFGPDFPLAHYNETVHGLVAGWLSENVPVKPGAFALTDRLAELGLPAAVATSTASPQAEERLGRAGLLDRFEAVITRSKVTRGKPHPDPFLTAAQALGIVPQACLALEDSHNGVRAAHAAGMVTVMVPDLAPPTDEIAALCRRILPNLDAVAQTFFAD